MDLKKLLINFIEAPDRFSLKRLLEHESVSHKLCVRIAYEVNLLVDDSKLSSKAKGDRANCLGLVKQWLANPDSVSRKKLVEAAEATVYATDAAAYAAAAVAHVAYAAIPAAAHAASTAAYAASDAAYAAIYASAVAAYIKVSWKSITKVVVKCLSEEDLVNELVSELWT